MTVELPRSAVICAAKHYIAAHESACTEKPVEFGAICEDCPELMECRGNWLDSAAPLFQAAGIYPQLFRD